MLKKLIKYDNKFIKRIMWLVCLIGISISVLMSLLVFAATKQENFALLTVSFILPYVLSIFAVSISATVIIAVRIYKNLYSNEGYLTFTLPVTSTQIMWSKILSGVIWQIVSILTVVIMAALPVLTAVLSIDFGENIAIIIDEVLYMLRSTMGVAGGQTVAYIVLLILDFIIGLFALPVLFMFAFTVGQLVNKSRVLLSIGVYFGFSFAMSIVMSISSTVLFAIPDINDQFFISEEIVSTYSLVQSAVTLGLYLIAYSLCYLFTKKIITKKLNLV